MQNEQMYLEIVNNIADGVYFVDKEKRITFWNKAAEHISGYTASDIIGKQCHETQLRHIDEHGNLVCHEGCPLTKTLVDGQQRRHTVFMRHKDGYRIPISVNIFPMMEEGAVVGAIEIFSPSSPDVYDEELIEKLTDSAMKDPLTGLPNRRSIESHLEHRLNELERFQKSFCVLYLDIDEFAAFNNRYGHDVGDEVLHTVARSITSTIRKTDVFGRWGGEEFVGVFEIRNKLDAPMLGEKIRAMIANSEVDYEGIQLSVTASLGITVAREHDTIQSVLKRADTLMYHSKASGKNCVTFG